MTLQFTVYGTQETLLLSDPHTIVAGYTGADSQAVQQHIDELAAIGVPPPATVPTFYPMPVSAVTQDPVVEVSGASTSGEVEPVLVRARGRFYLGVGSDHTDRELERDSVQRSKEVCPKPLGGVVVPLPAEGFDWDRVRLRCVVDDQDYQEGAMSALRPTVEVLDLWDLAQGDGGDIVLFGGTLPLLTEGFVFGRHWDVTLTIDGIGELRHHYTTHQPAEMEA